MFPQAISRVGTSLHEHLKAIAMNFENVSTGRDNAMIAALQGIAPKVEFSFDRIVRFPLRNSLQRFHDLPTLGYGYS
jgi:hypothetical protein